MVHVAACIDIGTSVIRSGIAGNKAPSSVFPSVTAVPVNDERTSSSLKTTTGSERSLDSLVCPILPSRKLDQVEVERVCSLPPSSVSLSYNNDVLSKLILTSLLGLGGRASAPCPAVFTEPTIENDQFRTIMAENLFETYHAPSILPIKKGIAAAFACARTTAVILDFGNFATTSFACNSGGVVNQTIATSCVGGELLNHLFAASLLLHNDIPPLFSGSGGSGHNQYPFVQPSYLNWSKRAMCEHVFTNTSSFQLLKESRIPASTGRNVQLQSYQLPDGQSFNAEQSLALLPECIMDHQLLNKIVPASCQPSNFQEILQHAKSLSDMFLHTTTSTKLPTTSELLGSVVISGGVSLCKDHLPRVQMALVELQKKQISDGLQDPFGGHEPSLLLPGWNRDNASIESQLTNPGQGWRLICSDDPSHRANADWIGASILASLGTFTSMSISKASYDDAGPAIFRRAML